MRRLLIAAACLGVACLAAVPASAGEPAPGRLLVTGAEYSLTLSRVRMDPGDAIVQFFNSGEDAHDMKMKRMGSDTVQAVGELESGALDSLGLRLRKGATYRLWCSLDVPVNHRDNGMEATLEVRSHGH